MNTISRQEIDLSSYKRRGMLEIFSKKLIPFVSTSSNVDITIFRKKVKENNLRFFASICFALTKVANEIPQFRHRILDNKLYEYSSIDPGYTVLLPDCEFSFCSTRHSTDFPTFYKNVLKDIENVLSDKNESNEDNNHQFYITSVPWFSFTSLTHPYDPVNGTIPIVALGKYFEENGVCKMPVGLQIHHGIMDGYHMGLFYEKLQKKLDNPDWIF